MVLVSNGKFLAYVLERQVSRIVPAQAQWKWEAMPYHDDAFLVNFSSQWDLERVGDGHEGRVAQCNAFFQQVEGAGYFSQV